tara:strand:- start:21758 stop:23758 length:2001 start_codon:yes stop_codon:yes gene_type:complete
MNNIVNNKTVIIVENYQDKNVFDFINKLKEINNLDNDVFINIDDEKDSLLGVHYSYDKEKDIPIEETYSFEEYNILDIIFKKIDIRNRQELITIVLNNKELHPKRKHRIEHFLNDSNINYMFLTDFNNNIIFSKNEITEKNIDVIGDVHGMFDDLIKLINKLGYSFSDNKISHPDNRKLLFLGDLIDRGKKSIEVLDFVMNAVEQGHYCISGNHEDKILQFKKHFEKFKYYKTSSLSSSETVLKLLQQEEDVFYRYLNFIESLPSYYTFKDIAFVHANIEYFSPNKVMKSHLLYGTGKENSTDYNYQKLYDKGLNTFTLIRGHFIQTGDYNNIFSLEEEQAFNGNLVALRLDEFLDFSNVMSNKEAFNNSTVRIKTNYNYNEHKEKFEKVRLLDKLYKSNLCSRFYERKGVLTLYNNIKEESFSYLNGTVLNIGCENVIKPIYIKNEINLESNRKYILKENVALHNIVYLSYEKISKDLIFSTEKFINDKKFASVLSKITDDNNIKEYLKNNNITLAFQFFKDKIFLFDILFNDNDNCYCFEKTKSFYNEFLHDYKFIRLINHYFYNKNQIKQLIEKENYKSFLLKEDDINSYKLIMTKSYKLFNFFINLDKKDKNKIINNKNNYFNDIVDSDINSFIKYLMRKSKKEIMTQDFFEIRLLIDDYLK